MASTVNDRKVRTAHSIAEHDVAVAAYFIWQERGCRHGHDVEDWYAAIEQLKRDNVPRRKVIEVSARNQFSFKQGLRGDAVSREQVNGLPVKEQMRVATPDGESAMENVMRTEHASTVTRSIKHPQAYRQDKDGEQLAAVQRILGEFNDSKGTDYKQLEADEKDCETDVWAISKVGGRRQAFQVTKCDTEPWRQLASHDASFKETLSEEQLLQRFAAAIDAKVHRVYSDIVLVLDGWPPMNRSILERLTDEYAEHVARIGFQEIWYSERGTGGQIRRLYPVQH